MMHGIPCSSPIVWLALGLSPFGVVASFFRRRGCPLLFLGLVGVGWGCDPAVPEGGGAKLEAEVPRLVIVGLDGLSWNLVEPHLERGKLPNLRALIDRGLAADLKAVEPLLSPPNWVSLATGRRPEVHGISHFFADRRAIRVPTLWDRLAASGRRVGLYDVLMTWPPRALPDGFVVPSWLRRDDRTHPADLWQRAGVEPYAYRVVDVGGIDATLEALDRELETKGPTFLRLVETFDPEVAMVTFYAVDVASHVLIHGFLDGVWAGDDTPPLAERHHGALDRILLGIDRAVGELVGGLGQNTHFVVLSDHGSGPAETPKRLWGWDVPFLLERAGLDAERDGLTLISGFLSVSMACNDLATAERLARFLGAIEGPAGEPLFEVTLHDASLGDGQGLAPWQLEMIDGHPKATAHVFASGDDALLDSFWPSGEVRVAGLTVPLERLATPHDFTGDHLSEGLFLAAGPEIAHRAERGQLSILDVTPLLYHLAGAPIPDDLEGRLDPGWLRPEALAGHRPRIVPADSLPRLEDDHETPPPDESLDDDAIRKKLEALGYVG